MYASNKKAWAINVCKRTVCTQQCVCTNNTNSVCVNSAVWKPWFGCQKDKNKVLERRSENFCGSSGTFFDNYVQLWAFEAMSRKREGFLRYKLIKRWLHYGVTCWPVHIPKVKQQRDAAWRCKSHLKKKKKKKKEYLNNFGYLYMQPWDLAPLHNSCFNLFRHITVQSGFSLTPRHQRRHFLQNICLHGWKTEDSSSKFVFW